MILGIIIGLIIGFGASILALGVAIYFAKVISKDIVKTVEKLLPKQKGFVVEPETLEVEKMKDKIRENDDKGLDTRLDDLVSDL